jgi:hypothetical protein
MVMEGVWLIVRALLALQLCSCFGIAEAINIDPGNTRKYSHEDTSLYMGE